MSGVTIWPAGANEAQHRERSAGQFVKRASFTRSGKEERPLAPGTGGTLARASPNQRSLTSNDARIAHDAVIMTFGILGFLILLVLAMLAGCVWIWSRMASRNVTRADDETPRRFDTTMGELRDMREALRSTKQVRRIPIRRT